MYKLPTQNNMSIVDVSPEPITSTVPPAIPAAVVVDVGATISKLKTDIVSSVEGVFSNLKTTIKTDVSKVETVIKADVVKVETEVSKVVSGHWFLTGFLAASVIWLAVVAFSLHTDKLALISKGQEVPTITK